MPTTYGPRKSSRAAWTQEDLDKAIIAVRDEKKPVRQAARENNIPEKTLRTRLATGRLIKGRLGQPPLLGEDAEKKLASHVKKLQAAGFAPTRKNLRRIAYNLAVSMNKAQRFNKETGLAGCDWYKSFMKRNTDLCVRKSQGISNNRAEGMNKKEIKAYFELLQKTLTEDNLLCKPSNIYNMDESGLSLTNEPGHVVAERGSKDVHVRKAKERGETVTVVACCNAEGSFLPPYCIFKGVNKKAMWEESMPPGGVITMRKKSAYIDEYIFMDWLENHFIPRKNAGKCLLLLDGHGSHINSPDILQKAVDNDISILCLPSHTTHYLQPLDRSFFKPLKAYWADVCNNWMLSHTSIERHHFGVLLKSAWSRAATVENGVSGFRATGIVPLNLSAIPDYAYLQRSDAIDRSLPEESDASFESVHDDPLPMEGNGIPQTLREGAATSYSHSTFDIAECPPTSCGRITTESPSTSSAFKPTTVTSFSVSPSRCISSQDVTPTKLLNKVSPIPNRAPGKRPARKQCAQLVTHPDVIKDKKRKRMDAKKRIAEKDSKKLAKNSDRPKKRNARKYPSKQCSKKRHDYSSSSEEDGNVVVFASSGDSDSCDEDECCECFENYAHTSSTADWIKCTSCGRWLHETCTIYGLICNMCGRLEKKKMRKKKIT